ncbi:MAG: serine/threonine protein kinase [SAR324 cluster bacterium]|uniref:Serine/threonine protein kinase n=1 Tax=SAR324 cluster bacterium TaxID=2024889 RepID=A0A7X9IIY0_9DELT|nr:serine/threonine protein kinase [SAR324 cluster bacterium]
MADATKKKKIFDDRYEILSIIGRGSQSVVYQAKNVIEGGPEVALKVLINKKGKIPNSERLRKEALAMVSCNHRYVIHLDDFHTIGDVSYLSMELAHEGDLRSFLHKSGGKLEASLIERFFLQTTEALDYIHKVGIIHRDVKPDNILILKNHEVRLGDFGIALLPGEAPNSEDLQLGVGTMDYLSPEILEGKRFNTSSDLYPLAIGFYEVIAGKTPFSDIPLMQQLDARKNNQVKSLSLLRKDIPPYFSEILKKMLEYDPAQRFQSAAEVIKALKDGREGKPILVSSKSTSEPQEVKTVSQATKEDISKPKQEKALEETKVESSANIKTNAGVSVVEKDRKRTDTEEIKVERHDDEEDLEDDFDFFDDEDEDFLDKQQDDEEEFLEDIEEFEDQRETIQPLPSPTRVQEPQHFKAGVAETLDSDSENVKHSASLNSPTPFQANNFLILIIMLCILLAIVVFAVFRRLGDSNNIVSDESVYSELGLVTATSFVDAISQGKLDFTRLQPGIYNGKMGALVPGREVPLSLIVREGSDSIDVLVGIEGWTPQSIPLNSSRLLEKPNKLRVASNGFVFDLKVSENQDSNEVKGEVSNIITGERGSWFLTPQM